MIKKKYKIECFADCASEIIEELTEDEYMLIKRISDRLADEGALYGGLLRINEMK